jgi:mannose-6-phosphate isomerase-like protein (cupin superfamily)
MDRPKFFKVRIDDAPTRKLNLDRGTSIKLVGGETGAAKVDVHINLLNEDSGPGEIHYHAHAENVYVVLEGTLEVVIEGEQHLLGPGEVGWIAPGVVHTAGNAGLGGITRILEIYAPAGADFHALPDWPRK